MKKTVSPLRLGKETLLHLSDLRATAAGVAPVQATLSQAGDSCLQSCYFNTCGDTCQWEPAAGFAS